MAEEIIGITLQVDGGNSTQTVGELRAALATAEQAAREIGEQFGRNSEQFRSAQASVAAVSRSLQEAGTRAREMGGAIEASNRPVASMRAQLREAQAELIRMQEEFGDLSSEALAAARNVAQIRDRIQDANEVAGLFDPGQSFQSVVGVGSAIASGFAAAQGALSLFGAESKEVEQALLKVQAAMALAQGLSAVKDSIKDFERLGAILSQMGIVQKANAVANTLAAGTMRLFGVATTQTGVAFNVLKGAIIATGIGALVVLLGTAIQYMMSFTSKTKDAADAQKKLAEEVREAASDMNNRLLKSNKETEDLLIARAKAEGKNEEYINGIRKKASDDRIGILKEELRQQDGDNKRFNAANDALTSERNEQEKRRYEETAKAREEADKKAKEAADKARQAAKAAADKSRQEREANLKAARDAEQQTADEVYAIQHTAEETEKQQLAKKFADRIAAYKKAGWDTRSLIAAQALEAQDITDKYAKEAEEKRKEEAQKKSDEEQKDLDRRLQNLQEIEKLDRDGLSRRAEDLRAFNEQVIADTVLTEDARKQILQQSADFEKKLSDAKIELAKKETQVRIQEGQAVAGALDNFAALAGEKTVAGKVLAVASATINTYLSAQQAFTAMSGIPIVGPALGAIAAAGAVAAGIANIKKIVSVQIPGKGGGGGGVPNATAPVAPSLNVQNTNTQLNQQSINSLQNATVKAIVVESDITESQERINRIHNAAKLA